jgi:predicted nucleotidyltransferase
MVHSSVIPVAVELHHTKLGPRVPLKSNSPAQWIAASGMMLRTEVGSVAHGTDIEGVSDFDEMGIAVEPKAYVTGLGHFEHYRFRTAEPDGPPGNGEISAVSGPGDLDLTVYGLRKFVRLLTVGNPSMITPLFVAEDSIRFSNEFGEELREHRSKFLSARVHTTYKGYLNKERLGLLSPKGTPKYAVHAIRAGMAGAELLERGAITIPPVGRQLELLRNIRAGLVKPRRVMEEIARWDDALDIALAKSGLPDEPEWHWINTWLGDIHLRHWREQ